MVYESLLLFGVLFAAQVIFILLSSSNLLSKAKLGFNLAHANEIWFFMVLGTYFVFFWQRSGQTLAMQTWSIKLVDNERPKLPLIKAVVRYFLAWLWFLPGIALANQFELKRWPEFAVIAGCAALWAATPLLDKKDRQFLHDRLAKTRLIHVEQQTKQSD